MLLKHAFKMAFHHFKDPTSNTLNFDSIFPALRAANIPLDPALHQPLLEANHLSKETHNSITFETFNRMAEMALKRVDDADHYQRIFALIDTDQKGYIDLEDLKKIRETLQPTLNKNQTILDRDLEDMLLVGMGRTDLDLDPNSKVVDVPGGFPSPLEPSKRVITLKQFCRLLDIIDNGSTKMR